MSILHLVRHGQASFGAEDYDNLSPKGIQQSIELGKALAKQQSTFDHIIVGPHRRHIQTFEGIKEGYTDKLKENPGGILASLLYEAHIKHGQKIHVL